MARTILIRGKETCDVLGFFQPNGKLGDIMGRVAIVQNYDEALGRMREWGWVV